MKERKKETGYTNKGVVGCGRQKESFLFVQDFKQPDFSKRKQDGLTAKKRKSENHLQRFFNTLAVFTNYIP